MAALDVHTAKWIVDKCFNGELIHGRTVLLVVCQSMSKVLNFASPLVRPIMLQLRVPLLNLWSPSAEMDEFSVRALCPMH